MIHDLDYSCGFYCANSGRTHCVLLHQGHDVFSCTRFFLMQEGKIKIFKHIAHNNSRLLTISKNFSHGILSTGTLVFLFVTEQLQTSSIRTSLTLVLWFLIIDFSSSANYLPRNAFHFKNQIYQISHLLMLINRFFILMKNAIITSHEQKWKIHQYHFFLFRNAISKK